MFVNNSHLPQLFDPKDYFDPVVFEKERDAIFLKGWHPIGTMADLPKEGDYFTTDRFGTPLICWRTGGQVQTFLNVCCHRFATLSSKPCGHFGDRMECQYHGWQYDATGRPRKIPDAPSFRPLVKDQLKLTTYRTERLGQLIFVTFDESAPSLAEWYGEPHYRLASEWFGDDRKPTHNFDHTIECNWKVTVENILESYHIATVHPQTFGIYPSADACQHQFFDHGDQCIMNYEDGRRRRETWAISKLAGVDPVYNWHHMIRYPNIVIANSCLVSYVQSVVPVAPGKTYNFFRAFHYPGQAGPVRRWMANLLLKQIGKRFIGQVLAEDAAVYPCVQQGMTARTLPGEGLVSVREERIFPFQSYVLSHLDAYATQPRLANVSESA
jgi:phenylpropionate dioxygenase-like ring-hydroxylating dioxygenase large terminal subunit